MVRHLRRLLGMAAVLALVPAWAGAQEAATITGTVRSDAGSPLQLATVFVEGLGIGTTTRENGEYTLTVPAARVQGQQVTLSVRLIGYRPRTAQITLRPGAITQDFTMSANPLQLGEVIITGAGTVTTREKLGNVINSVDSMAITRSNETNIVSALAAKAPNVEVKTQSGEPGASSSIRIRGAKSIQGTGQPLFVVDGMPLDNSTNTTEAFTAIVPPTQGTVSPNRASDINPNDIESIEILKGAAASAIYGARAAEGVVLITTKSGRAGPTRYSLRSNISFDKVDKNVPLQRTYGHGSGSAISASADLCYLLGDEGIDCVPGGASWGPRLDEATYKAAISSFFTGPAATTPALCVPGTDECGAPGAPTAALVDRAFAALYPSGLQTYDHFGELFRTGSTIDNTLSASGGNDRTTFFLSAGRTDQKGIFVGPNNWYDKSSARLKATHRLLEKLTIGGNASYTDARGSYIQKGSNLAGVFLGGLRTAPNFDSRQYLDAVTGLHRAYRYPRPSTQSFNTGRVYDNPFFVLNEYENTSELNRIVGNTNIDYIPFDWLTVKHTFGVDYYTDVRLEGFPLTSSGGLTAGVGEVLRVDIVNYALDHNLTATASYTYNENLGGSLTIGQNLNSEKVRGNSVWGTTLIAPRPFALQNTVDWIPQETRSLVHREGYFAQATADLYDQVYLTAAVRNDGFSTFGASTRRHWFPKVSAAWTFTSLLYPENEGTGILSFGKVRAAWGETGREPIVYQTITAFQTGSNTTTWGEFLNYTQQGVGGLVTGFRKGNTALKPERTEEYELGFDLGLFDQRADLSFTYYDGTSTDVILSRPVPYSTGFRSILDNAAEITNQGVEISLNMRPVTNENLAWDVGLQWSRNDNLVTDLAGAEFVSRSPGTFTGNIASMTKGYPAGVFRGGDFVRCGRGLTVSSVDIDNTAGHCQGAPAGAIYLAADGRPRNDGTDRVIGDPNPDWMGSVRSSLTFLKRWQLSGLLDIREGGQTWNGTKGALYNFGTHKDTEVRGSSVLIREYLPEAKSNLKGSKFAGPGVDVETVLNQNWFQTIGNSFSGPDQQDFEDASFVKLRELSLSYTADQPWVRNRLGLTSIDVRVSGRNLKTWTDYTGVDPETNLSGAEVFATGVDYFNNPASRSFVLSFGLNR